jgi:hypothetical protein
MISADSRALPASGHRIPLVAVIRLVVVAMSLAGIVAMHGLSVPDMGGSHCGPVTSASDPGHSAAALSAATAVSGARQDPTGRLMAAGAGVPALRDNSVPEFGPTARHADCAAMASCVAILLGLIGLAALHRLLVGRRTARALTGFRFAFATAPGRAPPQPIFLFLCVFRT